MKKSRLAFAFFILVTSVYQLEGQEKKTSLLITPLTGDFYIYTTWTILDGSPYPSNSMYLVTNKGVVLFDTPWDSTQFQPLLDSIKARHNKNVVLCIATHFHADRTAGLEFFQKKGIETWSSKQTYDLCKKRQEKQAAHFFIKDTVFKSGNYTFQTFYPGEGHTPDNIVIWFPKDSILYGGCFIKSTETQSLGNLADANPGKWKLSMQKMMSKFPSPVYVVPGHLAWRDNQSPAHTLSLLNNSLSNRKP